MNIKIMVIICLISLSQFCMASESQVEAELSKDQLIRLRCVEIVQGTNPHTGVSSNQLERSSEAAEQIKEMTEWCAHFILEGTEKKNNKNK